MMTKNRTERLVHLIEQAVATADALAAQSNVTWMQEDARMAAKNFRSLLEKARSGTLKKMEVAGLGITRALSEWAPKELYDAGAALENYYRDEWEPDGRHF